LPKCKPGAPEHNRRCKTGASQNRSTALISTSAPITKRKKNLKENKS
tara:strand:+ start:722 stop:862 length:141 start_codon:yes stop_codon:yes gene_type:complete